MGDVRQRETDLYETVWGSIHGYGDNSPGAQMVPTFLDMAQPPSGATILDAGCGAGKGAVALRAQLFNVWLCDVTDAGLCEEAKVFPFRPATLWHPLKTQLGWYQARYDYVYCCDVLEHVPLPFTMLVVARLLEVARRGVFLSISLRPDVYGVWVGQPLHQSVQSFTAWRDQLGELGTVVAARDLLTTGVYLVVPK